MSKDKLGLPPEYQQHPEYFDLMNISDKSDAKNALIASILKKYKVKTVLDLTCGTGSQVFYLHKKGFKCIGSDFSPALIKMAKRKAKQQKIAVKFLDGDMRTVKVGNLDSVITIDNAIGHVTKQGFAQTLKNVNRNLNPGGIYVFDILNLQAMTGQTVASLAYIIKERLKDFTFQYMQSHTIDRSKGRMTSHNIMMVQKGATKPEIYRNINSSQIYTAPQLKQLLHKCGFEVLEQRNMDGGKFLPNKTISMLTVARKI